jgi:hypothetical protein
MRHPLCGNCYHWDNFLLYLLWEADDLHVYREVDLLHVSFRVSRGPEVTPRDSSSTCSLSPIGISSSRALLRIMKNPGAIVPKSEA